MTAIGMAVGPGCPSWTILSCLRILAEAETWLRLRPASNNTPTRTWCCANCSGTASMTPVGVFLTTRCLRDVSLLDEDTLRAIRDLAGRSGIRFPGVERGRFRRLRVLGSLYHYTVQRVRSYPGKRGCDVLPRQWSGVAALRDSGMLRGGSLRCGSWRRFGPMLGRARDRRDPD